jgi:hypothetical protein
MTIASVQLGQPIWMISMVAVGVSIAAGLSLPDAAADNTSEDCRLVSDPNLAVAFQVAKLDHATQCRIGRVINGHTTRGTIGPLETPVGLELYEYLLDRPVVTAALVERLGIGTYRFVPRGPGEFWVEDGDGTEGLVTLIQQHADTRIYYIEGNHHGHIWSTVHATAVVFMKLEPTPAKAATVSTSLVSYARLDDKLFRGLVWLLRPLLEDAITRKLTRGFEATYLLGQRIAEDPARILQEVPTLPFEDADEARHFVSLIPSTPSISQPAEPIPTP